MEDSLSSEPSAETLPIQMWALIGAIILLIIMVGFAVFKTFDGEAVFYSSYFDLFLSFVPVIVFFVGCYFIVNMYSGEEDLLTVLAVASALGALIYNYFRAFQYNTHSKLLAFCVGTGRISLGYLLPIFIVLSYLGGTSKREGESEESYQARRTADTIQRMALVGALGILLAKLVRSPAALRINKIF